MTHSTTQQFWHLFDSLPKDIQELAEKKFALLKADPTYPSLHFKQIGSLWSVRIGQGYRALGISEGDCICWHWIGSHADYDKILGR